MASKPRPCTKVKFRDRISALLALARMDHARDAGPAPCRTYRCPHCRTWHLTSQPQRPGRAASEFPDAR